MGDRFAMIERACRLMYEHEGIRVVRTSGLWETRAMYVLEQADFLNGVCEVRYVIPILYGMMNNAWGSGSRGILD